MGWGEAATVFFEVIKEFLGMAERKEERNEGAAAQTCSDLVTENQELKHALDVANNPPVLDDSLRNGRF